MQAKTNILLTGASGGVGYEVLKQLSALTDIYNITAFDKFSGGTAKLLKPFLKRGINVVFGDITDKDSIAQVCQNKDVVIHLAALIPPVADEKPDLAYNVNVHGTRNLIQALEQQSPHAFLLYSSSISVYGDRISNPYIKVTDPLKPSVGDEYAQTKIKAEKLIECSALEWSIFRLTAIMGKHKISKLMFHMPLETPMEICSLEDTGRAFVNAIEKTRFLRRRIFNLGGGAENRIIYKDFLQRSFTIFGLGKLDFPKHSFADINFHCGYYADGDELENILHFRRDTLETYFAKVEKNVSGIQRFFTSIFKGIIKKRLFKESEPYMAIKNNNVGLIKRFFGFKYLKPVKA